MTGAEKTRGRLLTREQTHPVLGLSYAVQANPVRPCEALHVMLTVTNRSVANVFGIVLRALMPTTGVNIIKQVYFTGGASCGGNCSPHR